MRDKRVCVLGGAGFIGSHLVECLVGATKQVVVVDNYSTGRNFVKGAIYCHADLRDYRSARSFVEQCDIVFHLAADVGGRGYIEGKNTWGNVGLDASVFRACEGVVEKIIYFSSACVYPSFSGKFSESHMWEIEWADGIYGKAKLIGETMLRDYGLNSVVVRPFTVFGERMKEDRSIGALIAKTFIRQDPFEVWGNGSQRVDYIYVKDVVGATILAADTLGEGDIMNIGSESYNTPLSALEVIWNYTGWRPKEIVFQTDKPVSQERIADNSRLRSLGWQPNYTFRRGIERTVDWYFKTHSVEDVRRNLAVSLVTV